jgi:hypothetical protein
VTARRLTEPVLWLTEHGDVLRGEAGDWLVESPEGGRRTVRNDEFRATHEHVAGETWRRIGFVMARRSDRAVSLPTDEGTVTVAAGDWVVSSPDGSTWAVPDEVFRKTYTAADAPPEESG